MKINYKVGMSAIILAILAGLSGGITALYYQLNEFLPLLFQIHDQTAAINIFQTHARMMVFFVLQPALMVAFGSWFFPVLIGSRNFAFPLINILSIILLWTGFFFNFFSFFNSETGLMSLISLVFWSIGSVLFSINVLVTFINNRGQDIKYYSIPLFAWMHVISASFLLGVGSILLGILTRDYLNYNMQLDWAISQTVKNFVFPMVVVLILPSFGILFHIFQTISEKKIKSDKILLIGITTAFSLLLFLFWNKSIFTEVYFQTDSFANIETIFAIGLYGLIWVLSIFALKLFKTGLKNISTPMLWSLGCLFLLLFAWPYKGLIQGIDQIHSTLTYAIILSIFAGFYFWMGKIFGKQYSELLGISHFVITMIGIVLTLKIIPLGRNTVFWGDIFMGLSIFVFQGVIINAIFYNVVKPVANYWGKGAITNEWKLPSPMFTANKQNR